MELKLLNISRPLHPHGIIIDQKLFSREAHIGQLPLYVKCNNGHTLAYMFMMNELKLTGFFSRQQDLCFSHLPHRLSRLILPSPAFLKLISYSLIDITVLFRLYYPPGKSNGLSEGSGRFLRAALMMAVRNLSRQVWMDLLRNQCNVSMAIILVIVMAYC